MKQKLILYLLMFSLSGTLYAQRRINGKVTDAGTSEGMPGVNVVLQGTTSGTITDVSGNYTLDVPSTESILMFSFIGYETQEVRVGTRTEVNVALRTEATGLEEVVVVGYGTMRKSDLTGAVVSVSGDELRNSITTNVDQALQGRVAGVQVTQNSGQPGGAASIRIRGANSITGSSEPLYVIDGIPFQGDGSSVSGFDWSGGANGQNRVNPLSTINPNDIENIEVLKDASATAIYGARAANGVVLITTKRGKKGTSLVSLNSFLAYQQLPKKLDMMNLPQFADYRVQIDRELGQTPNQRYLDPSILGPGTDWQDEIFQLAAMHSHQISITGGTDRSTYAITGGFFDQDGIIINSNFKRFTTRMNLDHQVNDWIKVGSSLTYANTDEVITLNDGGDGVIQNALKMQPDLPVRNMDGEFAGPESNVAGISYNPVGLALLRNNTLERQRVMGNFYADLTFTKGLTFRSEIGFDDNHSLNKAFNPTFNWGRISNNINSMRQREESSFFWILKNYLTYNLKMGDQHNLVALLGTEAQRSEWQGSNVTKYNFASNDIHVLSEGDDQGSPGTTTDGWKGASSLASYFGRFNYNFADRYLITLTLRADGSSKFGSKNRWGYFPSGSFAWRLTEEEWMPESDALSGVKLRLGYGEVGNQAIDNYLYGSSMQSFPSYFGTAYRTEKIANPNLKWEATKQYNVGADMSLLSGHIDLTVDLYKKFTSDMLLQLSVPSYLGGSDYRDIRAPVANIGRMENKGIDIALTSYNVRKNNFSWTTNLTFTLNRNMIKELEKEQATMWGNLYWYSEFQTATMTRAGHPIGVFYGYITDGLFENEQDILSHAVQVLDQSSVTPTNPVGKNLADRRDGVWIGDVKFRDISGDGKIDTEDQTVIGDPNPDFTGGLNNSFTYGPFDLVVYLTGSYGADILNYQRVEIEGMTSIYNNQTKAVDNRARFALNNPSGSDIDPSNVYLANPGTTIPRYATSDNNRNNRMSDRFIEDGSYLRIQNVSLSYTIPPVFTRRYRVEKLRLYVNAQNVWTFTNYSGYDPEIGAFNQDSRRQNIDMGRYPSPRVFTMGIDLNF